MMLLITPEEFMSLTIALGMWMSFCVHVSGENDCIDEAHNNIQDSVVQALFNAQIER
jgi:hypothetical protein